MAFNGQVKTRREYEAESAQAEKTSTSDTPLTNAVASAQYQHNHEYMRAMTMHSRYLERELNETKLRVKSLETIASSARTDRRRKFGGMDRLIPQPNDINTLSDSEVEEMFSAVAAENVPTKEDDALPTPKRQLAFLRKCALLLKR